VVGLDLGERRVGVAVSDGAETVAVGHGVVERTGDPEADRRRLVGVVQELGGERVVVGLPLSLDGSRGPAARRVEEEAARLCASLPVPVELLDERFSTVTATRGLAAVGVRGRRQRRVVDEAAATVILQTWLDGRRHRAPSGPETEQP
jgi:putative Holliday junction resolvase